MRGDQLDSLDDAKLIALLARGDRTALGELVQRHQKHVLEIAYRTTGDRTLAEDIVQDTFLRVWRFAARYRPDAQVTTWLYRIVVNLCLDAMKKNRPKRWPGTAPEPDPDQPLTTLEEGNRAAIVRNAVAALPERQRLAVVLHRFTGLSQRAIADATGWSESAVESLLARAYARLRKSLQKFEES